ncbi:hypothetical protein HC776_00865 [bacterium]|nr:hypothetical protein [bacterium]
MKPVMEPLSEHGPITLALLRMPTVIQACEGSKAIVKFAAFPADKNLALAFAEYGDFRDDEGTLTETYRWNFTTDDYGSLLLHPGMYLPSGVIGVADTVETWQTALQREARFSQDSPLALDTPLICEAQTSVEVASVYPLRYGDSASVTLTRMDDLITNLEKSYHVFYGFADDSVTIHVIAFETADPVLASLPRLDSHVTVYGPSGDVIAENDNAETPQYKVTDSEISNLRLPLTGRYVIEVEALNEVEIELNSYTLLLEGTSSADTLLSDITFNRSVNSSLADKSAWTFIASEGDIITIDAQSSEFDIQVTLKGGTGDVLAQDDDSADTFLDARIEGFTVPVTGLYTVEITGLNNKTGIYTLTVSQ